VSSRRGRHREQAAREHARDKSLRRRSLSVIEHHDGQACHVASGQWAAINARPEERAGESAGEGPGPVDGEVKRRIIFIRSGQEFEVVAGLYKLPRYRGRDGRIAGFGEDAGLPPNPIRRRRRNGPGSERIDRDGRVGRVE
jgi:hypothetical protein